MIVDRGPDDGEHGSLSIRLLGTIEARLDDHALTLAGKQTRVLLAVLALSAGRVVSVDRIASALWAEELPANVRASVHTYVGRLRRAVGASWVTRESGGYRLCIEPGQVDLLRFAELQERAETADSPQQEYEFLTDAASLWAGEPFGAWANEWLETFEMPAWQERYIQMVERRADVDLAAGRAGECVRELQGLVHKYSLRESLWARWLTGLHRSGRTADALTHYEQLRVRISEELGVDPSGELQDIYAELLDTGQGDEQGKDASTASHGPRQLPAPVRRFVGRGDQLKVMDACLDDRADLLVLHGPAGAGKTSLVVQWAHQIADQFPDGQLWVNLRGYDTGDPVSPADALGMLLQGMGMAAHRIPVDPDERAAAWRGLAGARRILVVLDNARDSDHVRPLLTPGKPSLTLVTSRSQMRSLVTWEAADRVFVGPMDSTESLDLLRQRTRISDARGALEELADLCGHLPLALAIAAERVGRHDGATIDAVLEPLRRGHDGLAWLRTEGNDSDASLSGILDWTYATLDHQTANVFRLLGSAPSVRFTVDVVAALAGKNTTEVSAVIERLVDRHLVIEHQPGWYDLHDLTRRYVKDLALKSDAPQVRSDAVTRMRSWFVHTANNVSNAIGLPHPLIRLGDAAPGVIPQSFDDSREAFQWVLDHRRTIVLVAHDAADSGDHATVFTLIPLLAVMFNETGGFGDSMHIATMAVESAQAAGDARAEAMCAVHVGSMYQRRHQNEQAIEWLEWAQALAQRIRYPECEVFALTVLSTVHNLAGELSQALKLLESALSIAQGTGNLAQESSLANNLALAYSKLGRHDEAIPAAMRSVEIDQELGHVLQEAYALDTLGTAYFDSGQIDDACAAYAQSLEIHRQLGEGFGHAITLKNLGIAERERGDLLEAKRLWHECLFMLENIDAQDTPEISRPELRRLIDEIA